MGVLTLSSPSRAFFAENVIYSKGDATIGICGKFFLFSLSVVVWLNRKKMSEVKMSKVKNFRKKKYL